MKKPAAASPTPRPAPTAAEYAEMLIASHKRVIDYWNKLVSDRAETIEQVVGRLRRDKSLADIIRWGGGLEASIAAEYADEALAALPRTSVRDIIVYQLKAIEHRQRSNFFRLGSSSRFSNAVEGERANVAAAYAEKCRFWLDEMTELRANAEVL